MGVGEAGGGEGDFHLAARMRMTERLSISRYALSLEQWRMPCKRSHTHCSHDAELAATPPLPTSSVCSSFSCPLKSSFWFSGGTPAAKREELACRGCTMQAAHLEGLGAQPQQRSRPLGSAELCPSLPHHAQPVPLSCTHLCGPQCPASALPPCCSAVGWW